jgi:hypothetical protein
MPPPHRVGRVTRQVTRCFIAAGGDDVQFKDLMDWAYAGSRPRWRWSVYLALKRCGSVNVGYGRWAPSDELLRQIKGE